MQHIAKITASGIVLKDGRPVSFDELGHVLQDLTADAVWLNEVFRSQGSGFVAHVASTFKEGGRILTAIGQKKKPTAYPVTQTTISIEIVENFEHDFTAIIKSGNHELFQHPPKNTAEAALKAASSLLRAMYVDFLYAAEHGVKVNPPKNLIL